jgi:hypothetical protein
MLARSKLSTESIRKIELNNKSIIITNIQIAESNTHKIVTLEDRQVAIIM